MVHAPAWAGDDTAMAASPWRDRLGFCGGDPVDQPSGVLGPTQRATLRAVAARCKLEHDLLALFADRYQAFPAQLALSRTQAIAAIRPLLSRYGISDPSAMGGTGVMADAVTQADFDRLVAVGCADRAAALRITARLAAGSIWMLEFALAGLTAPDVRHTYLHLLTMAHQQLRTALAWSGR